MLTVRTSENTVITSFRLISERQDFSSVRTGENTVRARARIQDQDEIEDVLEELKAIKNRQVGVIQLNGSLDIDAVTSIFIRINSQGVPLSQADFVMSKIAANETYGGNLLRKCIDHFSHLSVKLEFFSSLKANDKEFVDSEYFRQLLG